MQQPVDSVRRSLCGVLLCGLLLSGCAKVNDLGLRLVTTKVDALLIANAQVLTGSVWLIPDRSGRVSLTAPDGAISNCSGSLRYTAIHSGEMDLQCNEGTHLRLDLSMLSETRGYGYGATPQGPVSVAFGLSDEDALAFLRVPPGKKLVPRASDGALELQ